MKWWQWLALWLALISGAIWATILFSLVLFPLFIHFDHLQSISGLSAGKLYANYLQLMAYLHEPWVKTLHLSDFAVSAHGAIHFSEVKNYFLFDIAVFILATPVAWRAYQGLKAMKERWRFVRPFTIGMIAPIVLAGLMAINFNAVFVTFHHVLFHNNYWLFDPATDPIINVLPEDFFMVCFALALLCFEVLLYLGIRQGRRDAKEGR